MERMIKIIRLWPDFSKVAKPGLKEFSWWRGLFFVCSNRPYMFSIRKINTVQTYANIKLILDISHTILQQRFPFFTNLIAIKYTKFSSENFSPQSCLLHRIKLIMVRYLLELNARQNLSFTNVDFVYYSLQNFVSTQETMINLILVFPCVDFIHVPYLWKTFNFKATHPAWKQNHHMRIFQFCKMFSL